MNKKLALAVLAAMLPAALPAYGQAPEGNWMVRLRAVNLAMDNKATEGQGTVVTAAALPANGIAASDKLIPEVDISYFFTKNIAAELILTVPQKQKLSVTGVGEIGTFKHLPPTLTLQYHFTGLTGFRPYVGAGLNYTNISSVKWAAAVSALNLNLKRNSYGLALQAGVDVPVGGGWLLNLDIKKVQIKTDVTSAGTKIGTFKVDPTLIGVGLGKRF